MLDGFLDEEFWQRRRIRDTVKGVRLEEPDEDVEELYQEAVNDVEVFMGAEFEEVPELFVVAEDSPREMFEDGVYLEDANAIIYNPWNIHRIEEEEMPETDWEPLNTYYTEAQKMTDKDAVLEELTHGLQDQKTGAANLEHSAKDHFSWKLGLKKLPEQAEFPTEGFTDYVTSYLGNQSLELTAAAVHLTAEQKAEENNEELSQTGKPSTADTKLNHTTERYIGHLFYKAIEQEEGVDSVTEEAFNPRGYDELETVFQRIENSGVNKDEEVYEFSKLYLQNQRRT